MDNNYNAQGTWASATKQGFQEKNNREKLKKHI